MPATDGTLVLGARSGDRSAFAELYDRRARLIRAICYDETRDYDAAGDLTQEVFLRAWRGLGELRDPQRFAPWLTGIARQVCREWRRRKRRETQHLSEYATRRTAAEALANSRPDERLEALQTALGVAGGESVSDQTTLSDRERLALHAFYLQGRDVDEARNVLGLSRSGFYRILSSACERLRSVLRREVLR